MSARERKFKKMKNTKKYLLTALCLALTLSLAGCAGDEVESSSLPESSDTSTVSEVSSAAEEESSTFVPADDLISTASSVTEGVTEGFDYEFSQNPIDKQYDKDYSLAASFSMMRQACGDAVKRWDTMIGIAYDAALAALPESERPALMEEQDKWLSDLSIRLDNIHKNTAEDNESILAAEKEIVLPYRSRAMQLCKIKYDIDGSLPDFPSGEDLQPAG